MAMGDPVLVTEQLTIRFLSLREAMKSYILFKVKQVSVTGEKRQHLYMQACLYFACVPVYVIASHFQVIDLKGHLTGLMLSRAGFFDKMKPPFSLLFYCASYSSVLAKIFHNPVKQKKTNKNPEKVGLQKKKEIKVQLGLLILYNSSFGGSILD